MGSCKGGGRVWRGTAWSVGDVDRASVLITDEVPSLMDADGDWYRSSARWLPNSLRRLRRVRCWPPSAVASGLSPTSPVQPALIVAASCPFAASAEGSPLPGDRSLPAVWLHLLGPSMEEIERWRGDLTLARIRENWTSWRGGAIEPLVREALACVLPDDRLPAAPAAGGYWTRTNDVEIDIVGADRAPLPRNCSSPAPPRGCDSRPSSGTTWQLSIDTRPPSGRGRGGEVPRTWAPLAALLCSAGDRESSRTSSRIPGCIGAGLLIRGQGRLGRFFRIILPTR